MSLIQKTNVTHSVLAIPHLYACVSIIMCVFKFNGQLKLKVQGGRLGSLTIPGGFIGVPGSPNKTPLLSVLSSRNSPWSSGGWKVQAKGCKALASFLMCPQMIFTLCV